MHVHVYLHARSYADISIIAISNRAQHDRIVPRYRSAQRVQ
jgi:hypothetical protein